MRAPEVWGVPEHPIAQMFKITPPSCTAPLFLRPPSPFLSPSGLCKFTTFLRAGPHQAPPRATTTPSGVHSTGEALAKSVANFYSLPNFRHPECQQQPPSRPAGPKQLYGGNLAPNVSRPLSCTGTPQTAATFEMESSPSYGTTSYFQPPR